MENFYLEQEEELFSIIDRIKRSRDDKIVLIVPVGLSALRSIINLRLLKEEAISLGKELSLVVSDELIRKLAQQSNIELLEKADIEQEIAKREESVKPGKVMSDIVIPSKIKEPEIEEPEIPEEIPEEVLEEKPFGDRPLDDLGEKEDEFEELFRKEEEPVKEEEIVYQPEKIKSSFKFFTKKRVVSLVIIIGIIGLGFVLYFVLPKAQVIIDPKKETIRFETEITADKDVDSVVVADNLIPGQVFQIEMDDSRKFPTTGEKDVEERARGKIMVYNEYSSSDQTLVKTTRFLSKEGKIFRLIENTVIPGATIEGGQIIASSKEVEVEADEAGEVHNIGPSTFTIPGFKGSPKYDAFRGESSEAMSGGAKGRMRVATQDDIDGAIEIVSLELKNKVQEQFDKKVPEDLKLLEETHSLEIIESQSSLEADQPGKDFTVTIKARAWGLAFQEQDVLYLLEQNVVDKISDNKTLIPSTINIDYKNTEADIAEGSAIFTCDVEANAAWQVDQEAMKNELAGKKEVDVRKYLSSLNEIETAKVIFWPFWVKKIPKNQNKIKIIIDIK